MNDEMDFDDIDDVQPWEDDAYETSYPLDDGDAPAPSGYEDMDGDHDSSMASAGWGTDEDYGHEGNDEDW